MPAPDTAANRTSARLAAVRAKADRMFALAEMTGVDPFGLELVRRRLLVHEHDLLRTRSAARRRQLERLIEQDIDELAEAFLRLARAVEHGGEA